MARGLRCCSRDVGSWWRGISTLEQGGVSCPAPQKGGVMKRIRDFVKRRFNLYDIKDLQTWGHCGCCGKRMDDEIFPADYAWGLCVSCRKEE